MAPALTIVEIIKRSDQGVTRPFLCRCDDGHLYYVKGRSAGARSLLCEWFAGHLAQALGLPIPAFGVATAPSELLELLPDGGELGTMPAFASRVVEHVQELMVSHIADVGDDLQRLVLVFDWWVRNQDRTLTARGGNPNLLWDGDGRRLVVIDHNMAFDPAFDAAGFRAGHAFSDQIPLVFQDLVERAEYAERLARVLAVWPEACKNAPSEWWFVDEERTVGTDFDPAVVLATLNRCVDQDFWN